MAYFVNKQTKNTKNGRITSRNAKGRQKMNRTDRQNTRADTRLTKFLRKTLRNTSKRIRGALGAIRSAILSLRISDKAARKLSKATVFAFFLVSGFLLGLCDLGFSVYPLGLALLIACEKGTLAAFLGSALSTLFYPALELSFLGVNALIYIIRKLLLSENHSEPVRTRVIFASLTGLFVSGALLLSDYSQTSEALALYGRSDIILACVFYCFLTPLSVYLLCPILSESRFSKGRTAVSLTFLGFCLILALSSVSHIGTILCHSLACILTLLYSVTFEPSGAVCAATVFGLATGNFALPVPLALASFVFTRLYEKRQLTVYPLFSAVCFTGLLMLSDFTRQPLHILTAVLVSPLLFMPIGLIISSGKAVAEVSPPTRDIVSEVYDKRMASLSGAFGSVSKLCYSFAGRLRFPTPDEAQVIIAIEASKVCTKCERSKDCRKKQVWCSGSLANALTEGKLSVEVLPDGLRRACDSTREIIGRVNEEYKRLLSERFRNNKVEILAREYASVARILKYTSKASSEDTCFDGPLSERAASAAERLGIPTNSATVYGTRRKILELYGVPVSSITQTSGALASYFGAELGTVFDVPEFILDKGGTFTMRFTSKERISVEYVKAVHTKCGEVVCGDTVSFFESNDGFFYALIADGMGSGREAAMTSRMTSVFVEKLLSGGAGKGVTMELLNSVLLSKSRESFSSVDLLEIDLIQRRAAFVKAGAAPAYLLRATKLFKVSSDTPPCGIIEGFCAENTSFDVYSGDIIIMLSDGVTSAIDCSVALADIMKQHISSPPEITARSILDLAVSASVHDDDMSCVLVRVK